MRNRATVAGDKIVFVPYLSDSGACPAASRTLTHGVPESVITPIAEKNAEDFVQGPGGQCGFPVFLIFRSQS